MKFIAKLVSFFLLGWALSLAIAQSSDKAATPDVVVAAPSGWEFDRNASPIASYADGVAVIAYDPIDRHRPRRSLVVQRRGETTVTTAIPGYVSVLEYSHDGRYLLVHYSGTVLDREGLPFTVALIDAPSGTVKWAIDETHHLHRFAAMDNSILVQKSIGLPRPSIQPALKIIDLAGELVREIDAGGRLNGALLVDSDSIVFARGQSVQRVSFTPTGQQTDWVANLLDTPLEIISIGAGGESTIRVNHRWYATTFLSYDGMSDYVFYPRAMAAEDPDKEFDDYIQYRAWMISENTVVLDDGSPSAIEVTISTGENRRLTLQNLPPAGAKLRARIPMTHKVVFVSDQAFTIRELK